MLMKCGSIQVGKSILDTCSRYQIIRQIKHQEATTSKAPQSNGQREGIAGAYDKTLIIIYIYTYIGKLKRK